VIPSDPTSIDVHLDWQPGHRSSRRPEVTSQNSIVPFADGTDVVIGACIEVHRQLGPGLLESTYEACVCHELTLRGVPFRRQVSIPLAYNGLSLDCAYRLDLLVDAQVVLELKVVERLLPIHEAQALTYLRLTGLRTALLVNFNVPVLRLGLRRLTNPALTSAVRRRAGEADRR
jgi:GxxExxY protein